MGLSSSFQSGFFGQLNKNIEKKAKKRDDMEKSIRNMEQNMEIYKSKFDYDFERKRVEGKRVEAKMMKDIGGYDSKGNYTDTGRWAMLNKNISGFSSLKINQQQALFDQHKITNPGTYKDDSDKIHGLDGGTHKSFSDATSVYPTVTKELELMNSQNALSSNNTIPEVPKEQGVTGEISFEDRMFASSAPEVKNSFEAVRNGKRVRIYKDKFGTTISTEILGNVEMKNNMKVNLLNEAGHVTDENEYIISQVDGEWKINSGPKGKLVPLGDQDWTSSDVRTSRAVIYKPDQNISQVVSRAFGAWKNGEMLKAGRNQADKGLQGAWNTMAEFIGAQANIFRSVDEGRMDVTAAAKALGINIEGRNTKEIAAAVKDSRESKIQEALVRKLREGKESFTEEENAEALQLARAASQDVRIAALLYNAAEVFKRGKGKLNVDDMQRMSAMIKTGSGSESFLASINEVQAEMYDAAVSMSYNLLSAEMPDWANSAINPQMLIHPEGNKSPGILYKIRSPSPTGPISVFVNSDTGRTTKIMSTKEFRDFYKGYKQAKKPTRIIN